MVQATDGNVSQGVKGRSLPRMLAAGVLAALIVGGTAVAVILYTGKPTEKPGEPYRMYPGAPEESVKAQMLSKVDFRNPLSVKAAPNIMRNASRPEKLVLINKLKEANTPEAAEALQQIVRETPEDSRPNDDLRSHAVAALVAMPCDRALQAVDTLVACEKPKLRALTATSLGYVSSERSLDLLKKLTEDASPEVRSAAADSIAKRKAAK